MSEKNSDSKPNHSNNTNIEENIKDNIKNQSNNKNGKSDYAFNQFFNDSLNKSQFESETHSPGECSTYIYNLNNNKTDSTKKESKMAETSDSKKNTNINSLSDDKLRSDTDNSEFNLTDDDLHAGVSQADASSPETGRSMADISSIDEEDQVLVSGSSLKKLTNNIYKKALLPNQSYSTLIIAKEENITERVEMFQDATDGDIAVIALSKESNNPKKYLNEQNFIMQNNSISIQVRRVSVYHDLSRIGIIITQKLSELNESHNVVVLFSGLASLPSSMSTQKLFAFVNLNRGKINNNGDTGIFYIDPSRMPELDSRLRALFPTVIDLTNDSPDID